MTTPSKPTFWQREPALLVGQVQAAIALAATLGFSLSGNVSGSVVSAATIVASLLSALVVRSKVSSPATVAQLKVSSAPPVVVPPAPGVLPTPPLEGP